MTTYRMTFAPVGGVAKKKRRSVGVIWHGAIRRRKGKYVKSTYISLYVTCEKRKRLHFGWTIVLPKQKLNTLYNIIF